MRLHDFLLAELLHLTYDFWRALILQVGAEPGQLGHGLSPQHRVVRTKVNVNSPVIQTTRKSRRCAILWELAPSNEGVTLRLWYLRVGLAMRGVIVWSVSVG